MCMFLRFKLLEVLLKVVFVIGEANGGPISFEGDTFETWSKGNTRLGY